MIEPPVAFAYVMSCVHPARRSAPAPAAHRHTNLHDFHASLSRLVSSYSRCPVSTTGTTFIAATITDRVHDPGDCTVSVSRRCRRLASAALQKSCSEFDGAGGGSKSAGYALGGFHCVQPALHRSCRVSFFLSQGGPVIQSEHASSGSTAEGRVPQHVAEEHRIARLRFDGDSRGCHEARCCTDSFPHG